jgi:hypothetical protein
MEPYEFTPLSDGNMDLLAWETWVLRLPVDLRQDASDSRASGGRRGGGHELG